MSVKGRKTKIGFFVFILCYIFFILSLSAVQSELLTMRVTVLFITIILFSVYGILSDPYVYGLSKMHWIFVLFFMGIAPLAQCAFNYVPWSYPLSECDVVNAQIVILIWCCCFYAATLFFRSRKAAALVVPAGDRISIHSFFNGVPIKEIPSQFGFGLLILSLIACIVSVLVFGLNELFFRLPDEVESNSVFKIIDYLCSALPAVASVFLLKTTNMRDVRKRLTVAGCLLITVLLNWPLSISRYWMAAIYGAIVLSALPREFMKNHRFEICAIGLIGIVFPLLYALKPDVDTSFNPIASVIAFLSGKAYLSVDFDAFSMLARSIQFTDENGIMFGAQIVSSILCFIPRGWWFLFNKSIATGEIVAKAQGAYYTNLSEPIMGEAYVDLSFIGVVVIAIAVAWFFYRIDKSNAMVEDASRTSFITLSYPFLLFLSVFICRGALFHALMRTYGIMLAPALVMLLLVFSGRYRQGSIKKRSQDARSC